MNIDIKDFLNSRDQIVETYREKGLNRTYEFCLFSSIPYIAMFVFLNDEFGGFEENVKDLLEFYGYSDYSA